MELSFALVAVNVAGSAWEIPEGIVREPVVPGQLGDLGGRLGVERPLRPTTFPGVVTDLCERRSEARF